MFVDAYFRMCSLKQLEPSLDHNPILNGGNVYKTKGTSALAWGICYLCGRQKLIPKQKNLIDLGATKSTKAFDKVMASIEKT